MKRVVDSFSSVINILSELLFTAAFVTLTGGIAAAQDSPGNITLFADPAANSCSITDQAEGPFTVYVIHVNMSGFAWSDFRVTESSGFLATYVSETVETLNHVGDFRSGINVAYGSCVDGPLLLGTITYEGHGTSQPCSYLDVVPWRFPWVDTQDCNFQSFAAPPLGKLCVNPQPGLCEPWCSVATEQTTWGGVKALYRN